MSELSQTVETSSWSSSISISFSKRLSLRAFERDVVVGQLLDLGLVGLDARLLDRLAHGSKACGVVYTVKPAASATMSSRARVERDLHQLLLGRLLRGDRDDTLGLEHVGDGARAPRLPPYFVKMWRISETVRLRLSVVPSTRMATPPGP